jgi:hypothetical protein
MSPPMFDRVPLRYLVPNAVTAGSMVLALAAIIQASRGRHESAAWLIVSCALLDRVDGVAARWMKACSEFGVQFDSLADLLAFCAAPALLVYFLLSDDPRYASAFTPGLREPPWWPRSRLTRSAARRGSPASTSRPRPSARRGPGGCL